MHKELPLSIIIPVAPGDDAWKALLPVLSPLRHFSEVLLVAADNAKLCEDVIQSVPYENLKVIQSPLGRAKQLNRGVGESKGDYLWFLHADSIPDRESFSAIERICQSDIDALYFFDLIYDDDGPYMTKLNAYGAFIRSRMFGLPFGDQGFILSKKLFLKAGSYDENASYGEDHLLIWKIKTLGMRILPIGFDIQSSARRYQTKGWVFTTTKHFGMFVAQAVPEIIRFLKRRVFVWKNTLLQSS